MAITAMNSITGTRIGVYEFVDKKKPRLCVVKGNEIVSYAVFSSKEAAEEFMRELGEFLGAKFEEDEADGKKEN